MLQKGFLAFDGYLLHHILPASVRSRYLVFAEGFLIYES